MGKNNVHSHKIRLENSVILIKGIQFIRIEGCLHPIKHGGVLASFFSEIIKNPNPSSIGNSQKHSAVHCGLNLINKILFVYKI